ncbi:MAG: NTP transferase domain-containing protein [Nitrosarchaeum sp.]
MSHKVCILAAGIGSRMGSVTDHINKALLPVNFKATISHIIEKFDPSIEIVIALGHKEDTVRDYLTLAHPERKFTFVLVDKYIGPGTGPGYSLLKCRDVLQSPFVFFAADTLVMEDISAPYENWFGVAPVKETEAYCTVKVKNNLVVQLMDKIKCDNKLAFIGLAGIKDYESFFEALEKNKNIIGGEVQVSNGFESLIQHNLIPKSFTWFDTGTKESYLETNRIFSRGEGFDFSKSDEFLYFVGKRVIKYFRDKSITNKRCIRAKLLKGLAPELYPSEGNFYAYDRIDGQVIYESLDKQITNDFLEWANLNLWKNIFLDENEKREFRFACEDFYKNKTLKRLKMFYEKTKVVDTKNKINGVEVPSLGELLGLIDWDDLINGVPSGFHGDLQFDNILASVDSTTNLRKFKLLDWRHEFGGLLGYGDKYYDLAKLYGGLTISYQSIKKGNFDFDMSGSNVYYNFMVGNDLIEAKEEYEMFVKEKGYNLHKIKILRALIFLNMSPLHHDPFDLMLYFFGKMKLYYALKEAGKIK